MKENLEKPDSQKEEWVAQAEGLKVRVRALYQKDRIGTHEKIVSFAQGLKEKYGKEVDKYALFHALTLSDFSEGDCESLDFSGEDSVEKFIESLEKRQGEIKSEE